MHRVRSSATVTAHQIPSIPQRIGRSSTIEIWNTNVRRNEMAAESRPLFKAVKNADPKILKPLSR